MYEPSCVAERSQARPKSMTLTLYGIFRWLTSMMFSSLRSAWIIPTVFRWLSALASWKEIRHTKTQWRCSVLSKRGRVYPCWGRTYLLANGSNLLQGERFETSPLHQVKQTLFKIFKLEADVSPVDESLVPFNQVGLVWIEHFNLHQGRDLQKWSDFYLSLKMSQFTWWACTVCVPCI